MTCASVKNIKKIKRYFPFALVFFVFFVLSCSQSPTSPETNEAFQSHQSFSSDSSEYQKIINKFSRTDSRYSGFYQSYQLSGTLLVPAVNWQLLQKKASFHQWDEKTQKEERDRALQEMTQSTFFLFSLYTPEKDYNDLNKGTSIWKIYLDVNGKRYEGKIKKRTDKPVDITSLFSYHTRWSIPYKAEFPVPTLQVEKYKSSIQFTSSLGSSTFYFEPSSL